MPVLVVIGALVTLVGVGGLGWCIWQGFRIRQAKYPPSEVNRRLHGLVAINLGSVALAALGLAAVVAGLML